MFTYTYLFCFVSGKKLPGLRFHICHDSQGRNELAMIEGEDIHSRKYITYEGTDGFIKFRENKQLC